MGREKRPPNFSRLGERALRAPGMLDAICHEFIRAIGDWRLAIGDCDWAQKLCAIRWADSLRLRLCPIGGQNLLHGFRDLVIRSSCKLDSSPCAICHEFIRMLVSSDWAQIVARLYEVGANSTVHRAHEFTFDQFTVRILRLVHFLFSFILEQLQNTGPYFQVWLGGSLVTTSV